jgi:RNA polymerase sigma-70 factor (ECF subfamily)
MDLEQERQLVERARGGDQDAYRQLVEQNQRQVYGLALRHTNRHEDADEIAQEAFIRAYRGLRRFRGECSFRTWLFRIAVNCCFSHKRKAVREPATEDIANKADRIPDDSNPSPLSRAMGYQTRALVDRALDSLSRQQRSVFVMKYLQHFSIAEISETLGCAPGTVKKQLFRAVGRMREQLAPLLGTGGHRK